MRYLVLIASIAIQICLGGVYAWSNFVKPLESDYGLSNSQTQLIFGVTILTFTIAMVGAGQILRRTGPRPVAMIGGVLFAGGYLLASVSGGSFFLLLLGIGIIVGSGIGFGYVCPLSTCVKWFPNNKGLVTGLAVAGFGAGAILLAEISEAMLLSGLDVLKVFQWVGIAYGVVVVVSAAGLSVPKGTETGAASASAIEHTFLQVVRSPVFWALVIGMFSGTFAGLMVVGNLKTIGLDSGIAEKMATMAIVAYAIGNAAGRISWGALNDKLGFRAVPLSLGFLGLSLVGLLFAGDSAWPFVNISLVVGFGFGACFVVYASEVAHRFGPDRVATIYPLIFLAYGISGLAGPGVGGAIYDATQQYGPAIWTSIGVVAGGLILSVLLGARQTRAEAAAAAAETS
ncbi:MAG: MFS transporter [Planctomycetota bacterium]